MRKWALVAVLLLAGCAWAKDKFQEPRPVQYSRDGRKWAERLLRKMTLEEKVGQLLMPSVEAQFYNVNSPDFLRVRELIRKYHVGGFRLTVRADNQFVFLNEPYEAAMYVNALQRESAVPLIFSADFERGLAMRFKGTTAFPHAMALAATGDPHYAEQMGAITAQEARAIGVEWNFYPIADVNSNPENPIINTRSFGEDPRQVGDFVAAYIAGAHQYGMLATAKHFPGHGDVNSDSHLEVAYVTGDRRHLDDVELPPFRRAIAAGADAVMTGHLLVPAMDRSRIATVSPVIIDDLLKKQLGFQGLVVSDALDMGALTQMYRAPASPALAARAALDVLQAGNDILLMPADLDATFNAIVAAVRNGQVPESRIDDSVLKILQAKAAVGLDRARLVDVNQLAQRIARPENLSLAQEIADRAVTLVRDNGQVLPLKPEGTSAPSPAYETVERAGGSLLAVIFVDDLHSDNGRAFEHELRARVPDANVVFVDRHTAAALTEQVLAQADRARNVVAAVYVIPSAGRQARVNGQLKATAEVGDAERNLLRSLLDTVPGKLAVVALGNPYIAADFPAIETYICTFSNMPVSEVSAVRALFAEIPFRGKLPVTIPRYAARGTGLVLPPHALPASAGHSRGGSYATH